ncbi:MAG: hypothetical protein EOM28_09415 [Clostridia bacterium]|nr:hypothetical protein [Clostridia bacterium]
MSEPINFKDILKNDLENTFFLPEEFAERHMVNGKEMDVLLDAYELMDRKGNRKESDHFDGIFSAELLMYVKVEDFGVPPKVGALLVLDGSKVYRVQEVTEEMGVYSIALGANKA